MGRRQKVAESSVDLPKMRPALTPEAREGQMISLAMDLVEQRLRDGTASSQETTHFLRLATAKEQVERRLAEKELELKEAKRQQIQSQARIEELYSNALKAMQRYSGHDDEDEFVEIIKYRAFHMLDGYFYPEYAMYMERPDKILGSFFVRHDDFRARIDDNQHFIDGYAKYYKLILHNGE